MDWFQILLIIAIAFYLLAAFQFYQLWKDFKTVNIGDKLSRKLNDQLKRRIKYSIILISIGSILNIIGTITRNF